MTRANDRSFISVALQTIGWPFFWGNLACGGLYYLVANKMVDSPFIMRYCFAHPIEYAETALFFVGLAALVLKLANVASQLGSVGDIQLAPRPERGQSIPEGAAMLDALRELPSRLLETYLGRRLEGALEYVRRKGTALGLDQELKHLADVDAGQQQDGYALVRICVWAIPMLGFLGTVVGITMALADLSPEALVKTPETAMESLLSGLGVAFDTTALALSLAVVLMFGQFVTARAESVLLESVDDRVAREMVGRFEEFGTQSDPTLAALKQVADRVMLSTEDLVARQAEIWTETISAAQAKWKQVMDTAGSHLGGHVGQALSDSIRQHAAELAKQESFAGERVDRHWKQLQQALTENARTMQSQQAELVKQGDSLLKIVEQAGAVTRLQQSLNDNLDSLSVTSRLDETVSNLSAAIHLLNGRLGLVSDPARQLHVHSRDGSRRAA